MDVIRTPPHFEAHFRAGKFRIANTVLKIPAGTVAGQSMRNSRTHDGVHESGFPVGFPRVFRVESAGPPFEFCFGILILDENGIVVENGG